MMACRGRRAAVRPACRTDPRPVCPYLRVVILPGSWAGVLEPCRPVFARRGTFVVFTVLATGMVAATGRRSVVGMLAGARMAQQISFHAACRFFSCGGVGHRPAGPDRGPADRDPAARAGRAGHGGDRRHPVQALGPPGLARVLDPRRRRPGRQEDRPGEPVGDRRDRGPVAVVHRTGVPAGADAAVGGQGHHHPGGAGRPAAGAAHRRVPATGTCTGSGTPPTTASRCWCPGRRGRPGYRPTPACSTPRRRGPADAGVRR